MFSSLLAVIRGHLIELSLNFLTMSMRKKEEQVGLKSKSDLSRMSIKQQQQKMKQNDEKTINQFMNINACLCLWYSDIKEA